MGGSIAVTGATGFVGQQLVEQLAAARLPVRALTRRPDHDWGLSGVTTINGALEDETSLERLVEGAEVVVHCAGLIKSTSAERMAEVNIAGTKRLVEVCARQDTPPRVVLMSSLAARSPEVSVYAASKRGGEEALAAAGTALHWSVLRPPAVYGPGDRETLRLFRMLASGYLPVPKGVSGRFSLIYVADLCRAVIALLRAPQPSGATYEIRDACDQGYTWGKIAETAAAALGRRVRCIAVPRWLIGSLAAANQRFCRVTGGVPAITEDKVREFYHSDWVCTDNPLSATTGWQPSVGIGEGFDRTIRWYREHRWL